MDSHLVRAWDEARDLSAKPFRSACYAPFTSLYLDPAGDVTACCQNTEHLLGNVRDERLTALWHGRRADELRAALRDYDLGTGCRFCAWQLTDGSFDTVEARSFEGLAVDGDPPAWPKRLELAISNTCNLACVMCNGDLSSRIRRQREGRAPLPQAYDEAFFDDLVAFLPHLDEVRLLGGEPLLARETLRVLDLLVELGLRTRCSVTTNGTIWNDHVEQLLETLPVAVAVSLDGASAGTVERIRVGADHAVLLENLARFRDVADRKGTELALTFCLMQQNWHEFADFLAFAEAWRCRVYLNTVIHPDYSLYHLPVAEARAVLAGLEARDGEVRATCPSNLDRWDAELDRLRAWVAAADATPAATADAVAEHGGAPRAVYFQVDRPVPVPVQLRRRASSPSVADVAHRRATEGMTAPIVDRLHCDVDDVVRADRVPGASFLGLPTAELDGLPFAELAGRLADRHGQHLRALRDEVVDGGARRRVLFRGDGAPTYVQTFSYVVEDGTITVAAWSTTAPTWAPG